MSGRYAFSMPDPRQRDGWFRIGSLDMTTTNIVVGLGLLSMIVYAIDPASAYYGAFSSTLVRQGEIWRLFTWPIINPPSFWTLLGLVFFWYFGHQVEDQIGRKPQAWLLLSMTVLPAAVVSLFNTSNGFLEGDRWAAYTASVSLLSLGLLCVFALDRPNAPFFFGIPAWVIAAVIVAGARGGHQRHAQKDGRNNAQTPHASTSCKSSGDVAGGGTPVSRRGRNPSTRSRAGLRRAGGRGAALPS